MNVEFYSFFPCFQVNLCVFYTTIWNHSARIYWMNGWESRWHNLIRLFLSTYTVHAEKNNELSHFLSHSSIKLSGNAYLKLEIKPHRRIVLMRILELIALKPRQRINSADFYFCRCLRTMELFVDMTILLVFAGSHTVHTATVRNHAKWLRSTVKCKMQAIRRFFVWLLF